MRSALKRGVFAAGRVPFGVVIVASVGGMRADGEAGLVRSWEWNSGVGWLSGGDCGGKGTQKMQMEAQWDEEEKRRGF